MIKILKKTLFFQDQHQEDIDLGDFKKLYLEHVEYIRNLIFWMVRNDEVDDLVQETFFKAWNSRSKFNFESNFRTWIHRIAVNTTHDYFREGKNKKVEIKSVEKKPEVEAKDIITKALNHLNIELREIFILYYKFGYTSKEISKILDQPDGTIKFKLMEGRNLFKEFYLKESKTYE